jgi:hypothetical protein
MNYLKYIEHAAENLQFFLWFRDYSARFNDLADGERALSPEWTREQVEAEATSAAQQTRTKHANVEASAILKDTSFDDGNSTQANERGDPSTLLLPPRSTRAAVASRLNMAHRSLATTLSSPAQKRAESLARRSATRV